MFSNLNERYPLNNPPLSSDMIKVEVDGTRSCPADALPTPEKLEIYQSWT
jgi:hypothetical protein